MRTCQFHLNLSVEQCQRYYNGGVQSVIAHSEQGVRLAFPASQLRRFVTRDGVHGRFEISFDADCKLVSLNRLGP